MWANVQHDDCPAEYRWRPLFNAALQFGWRPLLECRAVTLPRSETRWNLQGWPKLTKRSQPLVGRSSPYCGDMLRRYGCLTSFFPIVDTCLSCKDIVRQSCGIVTNQMATFWRFVASCILYFQRAACSTFHNNRQTITGIGKINLFYRKLSKVNKVWNMLISTWRNAVMFGIKCSKMSCHLQRRLSVNCAIHW